MLAFYFAGCLVIWLGILSLRNGLDFASYIRRETTRRRPAFTPFASVIAPNRGLDQGLRENITALFNQDYPAYEIVFVTDKDDDPSLALIKEIATSHGSPIPTRIVIAGEAIDSGQKVHNLRVATSEIDPPSEVFVFVDTDARPHPGWLKSLVAPLLDEHLGATTGY
ncbi:MAG: glycosyltransferase, partial [Pyrinomonadaceae bacterium]